MFVYALVYARGGGGGGGAGLMRTAAMGEFPGLMHTATASTGEFPGLMHTATGSTGEFPGVTLHAWLTQTLPDEELCPQQEIVS